MQSVDYIHGWWVLRACGRRNPLVRASDRLELLISRAGNLGCSGRRRTVRGRWARPCTMRAAACTSRRPRHGTP